MQILFLLSACFNLTNAININMYLYTVFILNKVEMKFFRNSGIFFLLIE